MSENDKRLSDNASKWDYNAPQYVDFRHFSDEVEETNVEDYFNYDHEREPFAEHFVPLPPSEFGQVKDLPLPDSTTACNTNGIRSSNESNKESTKGEMADTISSPCIQRGRKRLMLDVNEERKRMSMSVDRGKDRLKSLGNRHSNERIQEVIKIEETVAQTTCSKPPISQSVQSLKDPRDIVAAITEGVKEEVRLEGANSLKQVAHNGIPMKYHIKLTQIQPFSFEKRDIQLMNKRDEFVKKVHEEEKKAREFKAHPFPDIIFSKIPIKCKPKPSISVPQLTTKVICNSNQHTFKAKPAAVLHKIPFKPVKAQHNIIESVGFQLNTQQRAEKRAEWQKYLKEKEQQREDERVKAEKKKMAEEEEKVRLMRIKLVHKPLPIPQFIRHPLGNKPQVTDKENRPLKPTSRNN